MKSPILKKLALEEAYQHCIGLFTKQLDPHVNRPLAAIAYHPGDDLISGMYFHRWSRAFVDFRVSEVMGMSFTDMLELTPIEGLTILATCREQNEMMAAKLDELEQKNKQQDKK